MCWQQSQKLYLWYLSEMNLIIYYFLLYFYEDFGEICSKIALKPRSEGPLFC